jgi:hypothetical protein
MNSEPTLPGGKNLVLIVEDSLPQAVFLRGTLEKAGYEVATAANSPPPEHFHRNGENRRAIASRNFAGSERASISGNLISRPVEIFFATSRPISPANPRP